MKIPFILPFLLLFLTNDMHNNNLVIMDNNQQLAFVNKLDYRIPYLEGPFINSEKYLQLLNKIDEQIYQPPKNATLDSHGNIVASQEGYSLDRKAFSSLFYQYYSGQNMTRIHVPKKPIYPEVDDETLASIKVKLIGRYVTYYRPTNKERSQNIFLSAKAINNHVVFPGERFSFNGVVGKRTKAKGYLPAPEIVEGELSEGIGGGICQVSSTLFNAVDNAGVKITERYSHSRNVAYVPSGRDATVSWNGPDLAFKNNYHQPILIRAKAYHGTLVIQIYSSDTIHPQKRNIPGASEQIPKEVSNPYLH